MNEKAIFEQIFVKLKFKHLVYETIEDVIQYSKETNPKRKKLTIETLRMFPGCGHYNDDEATEIVETIDKLCLLAFEMATSNEPGLENLQLSIPFNKAETEVPTRPVAPENSDMKVPNVCSECKLEIRKSAKFTSY
jgi:hypothetical protein